MNCETKKYAEMMENFVEKYYTNSSNFDLNEFYGLLELFPSIIMKCKSDVIKDFNNYLEQMLNSIANMDYYRVIDLLDGVIIDRLKEL